MQLISDNHEAYLAAKELFYITPDILNYSKYYSEFQSAIIDIILSVLDEPPSALTPITTSALLDYVDKIKKKVERTGQEWEMLKMERYRFVEYLTQDDNALLSVSMQIISLLSHDKTGSIVIMLEDNEWDEELSAKTINSITLSSIKFPYKTFAIDASKYNWKISGHYFDTIIISMFEGSQQILIYISSKQEEGISRVFLFSLNESIQEMEEGSIFSNNSEELTFIIGRIVSIAMYIGNFSSDNSRVADKIVKLKKNKKKNIFKNRQMRVIKLKQPSFSKLHTHSLEERSGNAKAFVVRGHWRNQSYVNRDKERFNKAKWIDPYIKGEGKEYFQKVIKI